MFDYRLARPNESKLCDYLDKVDPDWKEIAESLLGWLYDDDVRRWAENEGYDIFDEEEEEEEMKKFEVVVHYEGSISYTVEANDEDEAKEIAEGLFCDEDDRIIASEIADVDVCDCWETEGN